MTTAADVHLVEKTISFHGNTKITNTSTLNCTIYYRKVQSVVTFGHYDIKTTNILNQQSGEPTITNSNDIQNDTHNNHCDF